MKHTSINLSEEHAAKIEAAGKSPTTIIREALDLYFNPTPSALELIRDHEHRYHMPENAHKERISMRKTAHELRMQEPITVEVPQPIPKNMPKNAHISRTPMRKSEHKERILKQALGLILENWKKGIEPTPQEIADAVGMESRPLGSLLGTVGVKSAPVKGVRLYPMKYMDTAREALEKLETEQPGFLS